MAVSATTVKGAKNISKVFINNLAYKPEILSFVIRISQADLSADLDESILSQSLTLAASCIYNIEGLGRVFSSLKRRGHAVPLTGTYVSSGELLSIFLNGGIVNPNLLTFRNYGFTDDAPSKEGIRYNHFILYNKRITLPITEK